MSIGRLDRRLRRYQGAAAEAASAADFNRTAPGLTVQCELIAGFAERRDADVARDPRNHGVQHAARFERHRRVSAFLEIGRSGLTVDLDQDRAVVVASGSDRDHAGLIVGQRSADLGTVGETRNYKSAAELAKRTARAHAATAVAAPTDAAATDAFANGATGQSFPIEIATESGDDARFAEFTAADGGVPAAAAAAGRERQAQQGRPERLDWTVAIRHSGLPSRSHR